eukprot:13036702-Ditylum_brightwellii.AAC.2
MRSSGSVYSEVDSDMAKFSGSPQLYIQDTVEHWENTKFTVYADYISDNEDSSLLMYSGVILGSCSSCY